MESTRLRELAVAAATAAGDQLLERFRGPATGIESKSSATDLVSDADRDAEALLRGRIIAERPDDALLGEEHGEHPGGSGLRWLVDPLDGTTNFLYGLPQWSVSVACEDEHGLLVGVVHHPCLGETFVAERGAGAALNGRPIHVSAATELSGALLGTGFSYLPEERRLQALALARILPRVRDVRRGGSAALDLAWVACGRFDGYYEVPIKPWDRAAGILLVCEAGGVVTRLDPIGASGDDGVVASGGAVHAALEMLVRAELFHSQPKNSLH